MLLVFIILEFLDDENVATFNTQQIVIIFTCVTGFIILCLLRPLGALSLGGTHEHFNKKYAQTKSLELFRLDIVYSRLG